METYEGEKYYTTKEKLKKTIEKYGVAIIPNVFSDIECDSIYSKMWDFFEHITNKWNVPLNRQNQKTWKNFNNLCPLHSMLVQYYGIGQAQFAWEARQNQKAIDIFSYLWKTNDLLVSFDGSSLHLPPEITNRGWYHKSWYHTDQSYTRNKFECVQSFVTLRDINDGDATLAVMESSNKYHEHFKNTFGINNKDDWYKLSENQEKYYFDKGCKYKRIKCPKGSMVFWDSRTIHCGVEPLKNRNSSNIRAVVYLCYSPKKLITEKNLEKKQNAFNNLRTTNHYPCSIKLFPKKPRTYGNNTNENLINKINEIEPPVLTPLGKKLAGF